MSEKLQGTDRLVAIDKVKDQLDEEIVELDDTFLESLSEEQLNTYNLLVSPLEAGFQPYEVNPHSPTPADPHHLTTYGAAYYNAAMHLLESRLNEAVANINISAPNYDAILNEILIEHERQCRHQSKAFERLLNAFRKNPEGFGSSLDEIITPIRSGEAETVDRLTMLFSHPEVDAIEDMKFTAPFDLKGIMRTKKEYLAELMAVNFDPDHKIKIELMYGSSIKSVDHLVINNDDRVRITKSVIAEATYSSSDKIIEFVEQDSFYLFPTVPQLRGVTENIIKINGKSFNAQPKSISVFLRIKSLDGNDIDNDLVGSEFDSTKMPVVNHTNA